MRFNRVILGDARDMKELQDETISLVVTSPPYNCGIEYNEYNDDKPFDEYLELINDVWKECFRVLKKGGRLCINVANIMRKPYIPLNSYISRQCLKLGFLMRGEIIWLKGGSTIHSTAWGSWKSCSNPFLRDSHEYILVFSKDEYKLEPRIEGSVSDISDTEFALYTQGEWKMRTANTTKAKHPAPFPEELAKRLIKLYSYPNDVVLDCFAGSGTVPRVAKRLKRKYIAYEIDEKYVEIIRDCLKQKLLL